MTNGFHVIKDPVHGTMQFSTLENAWVKPFIDDPLFQRLRHIKQLGLGDYIFPGATHTRFNHSLGCSFIAGQMAQKIGLEAGDRQIVMIAALLHDIGHGPFSHAFEWLFHDKLIKHEDWTIEFLNAFSHDAFFERYNQKNPQFRLTTQQFSIIADIIMHRDHQKTVLSDIVSSQLDADRLDYLLRDSHFCGVKYGEFDLRWLLHCLSVVKTPNGERLGINHKGIGAVEHYLMARRLMLRNLYHGHKKLAFEYYLILFLQKIAQEITESVRFRQMVPDPLASFLIGVVELNQKKANSTNLTVLKNTFIKNYFASYQQLFDYHFYALICQFAQSTDQNDIVSLAKKLHHRRMPIIIRLDDYDCDKVAELVREFKTRFQKQFKDWQVNFIQTPQHAYSGEDDPIYVLNEDGMINPINDSSLMLNAISDKSEHVAFVSIDTDIKSDNRIIQFIQDLKKHYRG